MIVRSARRFYARGKKSLPKSFFNKVTGWKPETVRSSHWRCVKQGVLKNFANFTRVSFQ